MEIRFDPTDSGPRPPAGAAAARAGRLAVLLAGLAVAGLASLGWRRLAGPEPFDWRAAELWCVALLFAVSIPGGLLARRRAAGQGGASGAGASEPERVPAAGRFARTLAACRANLRAGYALAVRRPISAAEFAADAFQLALLLTAQGIVFGVADYLYAGPAPSFNPLGLADYSASVVLFLLSGLAIAAALREAVDLPRLLVAIAAGSLVSYALYFVIYAGLSRLALGQSAALLTGLYALWVAWNLVIVQRAVVLASGCPRGAALLPVSLFALFNLAAVHALPEQDLFLPAEDSTAAESAPADIDGETLFYRQAELLEQAVGGLAGGRPGIADLYFVGFAGEADEHVFAHEIEYARGLFDHRFGTAGRSVALVNSPDTAARLPLANAHNLEAVLRAVAKRMNRDEDVLFLFLTSHGSADHRLSVRFEPLPLNDLPAPALKELLDRAGIRHRIIVVSACYSGGFLDVLKDDDSLILTAASRDRPSFGCGTEAEFTYFGEAFFVQALRDSRSFIEAFGKARQWIEAREKSEGKEPSLPQLHVGAGIMPRLRALEAAGAHVPAARGRGKS